MITPFGHSSLIFIAAFLDALPPPHQDPIPDRLFARDPVATGEHPSRKTMIVNPAPDGPLVPTHEAGNGPNSPLKMSVSVSSLRQDNDLQTNRDIAGQHRHQQHSRATGG